MSAAFAWAGLMVDPRVVLMADLMADLKVAQKVAQKVGPMVASSADQMVGRLVVHWAAHLGH